jgi:hypothetical protein
MLSLLSQFLVFFENVCKSKYFKITGCHGSDQSLGHGDVDFENIIRKLNSINYKGPLSVEWEDSGMNREIGAKESCEFVRNINFSPSDIPFGNAIKTNLEQEACPQGRKPDCGF